MSKKMQAVAREVLRGVIYNELVERGEAEVNALFLAHKIVEKIETAPLRVAAIRSTNETEVPNE